MLTQLHDTLWIVDGAEVIFAGAPMATRMTVARLEGGGLWVHSPIALNAFVRETMAGLGDRVVALIAPNKFHHLFMEAWRTSYPDARVFAEATLKRKVATLANAETLTGAAPDLYAREIDQVLVGGNRLFQEAVFFHRASRTAIFTDLIVNLRTEGIGWLARQFLRFEGVVYPTGGVPRLYRWLTLDRAQARQALDTVWAWAPERLVFSHGEPFEAPALEVLEREFAYLRR